MRRLFLPYSVFLLGPPLAGCYPQGDYTPLEEPVPVVRVIETVRRTAGDGPMLIGHIEPWRETVLYFEVTGVVEQVYVREGDLATAGQTIARLIPADFQQTVLQARAELAASQARLSLLEEGTRQEVITEARATLRQRAAAKAFFAAEFGRIKETFQKGSATQSEFDAAERNLREAIEAEAVSRARLELAIAGPRQQEIRAAKADVVTAQAALELARRQLAKATLTAPFAGRIERRFLDEGAYINVFPTGGVPVVQLIDIDQVEAVIDLPLRLVGRYAVDQTAEIRSSIDPRVAVVGRVTAIGQVSDQQSGAYELRVRLANPDHRLLAGMVVTTTAPADDATPRIHVPLASIRRDYDGTASVLVYDQADQRVQARIVRLGEIAAAEVEVLDGLNTGELVVTDGHHRLVPGDRARVESSDTEVTEPHQ